MAFPFAATLAVLSTAQKELPAPDDIGFQAKPLERFDDSVWRIHRRFEEETDDQLQAPLEDMTETERRRWWDWGETSLTHVKLVLWTKENPWNSWRANDNGEVQRNWWGWGQAELAWTKFDPSRPTKLFIHGFTDKILGADGFGRKFLEAYQEQGSDYNLIGVEWEKLAAGGFMRSLYSNACDNVLSVGTYVAEFLAYTLMESFPSLEAEDIHCIGHSLGAQMCGRIGREFYRLTRTKKLGRVTGLDPAAPEFVDNDLEDECLSKNDADYVDIIHSNGGLYYPFVLAGTLGSERPMGHVDYYLNGGTEQPGCDEDFASEMSCNHARAVKVFQQSIGNPQAFAGTPCYTMDECSSSQAPPSRGWSVRCGDDSNSLSMVKRLLKNALRSMTFFNTQTSREEGSTLAFWVPTSSSEHHLSVS